jgi:hypothetical protein
VKRITGDFRESVCQKIWGHLQRENPEMRKAFTLDQSGFTHSGQTITAAFQKERVWQNVYFQIFQRGWIRYEHMVPRGGMAALSDAGKYPAGATPSKCI